MILRKSMYRNLKEKKFQYLGVITLLILSVMLYVSLSMAISTLEVRNETFSEDYNQESFHFIAGQEMSEEQVNEWEKDYQITLEQREYKDIDVDEESSMRLFSMTETINVPFVSEGELPSEAKEIAVSEVFAKKNSLGIGDTLDIENKTLTITGFVYLPDYIYMIEQETDMISDPAGFGVGVTQEETLLDLSGNSITQVLGLGNASQINDFQQALNQQVNVLKFLEKKNNPRIQYVNTEIEGARATMTTLPLFILALSIIMVLMLMKRRLEMQRKEIGTLMALGYRGKELRSHYLGYAWVIGLTGTILGVLAGAGLSVPLTNLYGSFYNLPSISYFDFDPMVLIVGFVVPVILLLLLTALVIRKPLNQSPLTLLRPKTVKVGKKSFLERLPILQRGSFIKRFRLRLMIRSKARSVYIFLGVMFSTILLFFGFISFNSMDQLVEDTYEKIQTYEYAVHYRSLQENDGGEGSPFTLADSEVIEVNGEELPDVEKSTLYGMLPETDKMNLQNGDESLNEAITSGFVISKPLAAIIGAEEGDEITLENSLNNNRLTMKITGVAEIYIGANIYHQLSDVNEFLGYPSETHTGKWLDAEPEQSDEIFMIESKQEIIDNFESISGPTRYSVFGMAAFAILIGVIVLTLLTNLIVEENSPSISLFKVMGYHDREISKLVLSVYTPIVILSYFLSIPLSLMTIEGAMNSLVSETGFLIPVIINVWMILIGFAIILLTYWLSLALSRRKLKRISLQEALKKQQD
ncbi:ABC transporter permease [Thalassobacillus hwangdonensis]|uniref:ABC transporter permease n=1 Tax=Thalassobacillus hwangdonensis TaxID=546108 RepID=A0ABW3L0P2_9BACI